MKSVSTKQRKHMLLHTCNRWKLEFGRKGDRAGSHGNQYWRQPIYRRRISPSLFREALRDDSDLPEESAAIRPAPNQVVKNRLPLPPKPQSCPAWQIFMSAIPEACEKERGEAENSVSCTPSIARALLGYFPSCVPWYQLWRCCLAWASKLCFTSG